VEHSFPGAVFHPTKRGTVHMDDRMVIGIAGGSGSGKTTLTQMLTERLGSEVAVLSHDSYYRAHHDLPFEERTRINYDHPNAYETDLMARHLVELLEGKTIACPVYDFAIHDRREGESVAIAPAPVIIVEGILILADEGLRRLMDVKVFVDAGADVRILRRTRRDMAERGRSLEGVMEQYLATVKPMHERYVEPSRRFADIVVATDGEARMDLVADMLASYAQMRLGLPA
jgi:uridine kinase